MPSVDLDPGERVLLTKRANYVVRRADAGLEEGVAGVPGSGAAIEAGARAVGMAGREALGGRLTVTDRRLVFATHGFNRVTGTLTLALGDLLSVRDVSRGLVRQIEVRARDVPVDPRTLAPGTVVLPPDGAPAGGVPHVLVVWGVRRVVATIRTAAGLPQGPGG